MEHVKILLVEPDSAHRNRLKQQLQQTGYAVTEAETGQQAMDILSSTSISLLLLSAQLSDIPAQHLLSHLHQHDQLSTIPVLLLVPTDDPHALEPYFAQGITDYLSQPYHPAVLKARVQSCQTRYQLYHHEQDAAQHAMLLKIEHDIQIARDIQLNFLPVHLPELEGWEIETRFHPAREVSGDFYDLFMLTQNRRLSIIIADVCDKGVGAALFMALSRSLLRAFAQQHYSTSSWTDILSDDFVPTQGHRRRAMPTIGAAALKNAVALTNTYITSNHSELNMFFTLFFGVLDPASGQLLYVNCGNNAPLVIGADGTIRDTLQTTGPAIGMLPDIEVTIKETQLEPGDTLYCYTDGVTDIRNPQQECFGNERLEAILTTPAPSASHLLDRLEDALQQHMSDAVQFDDITMLALRREAGGDEG